MLHEEAKTYRLSPLPKNTPTPAVAPSWPFFKLLPSVYISSTAPRSMDDADANVLCFFAVG